MSLTATTRDRGDDGLKHNNNTGHGVATVEVSPPRWEHEARESAFRNDIRNIPGLAVPLENWHRSLHEIAVFLKDMDSTLFMSELTHDKSHRLVVAKHWTKDGVLTDESWQKYFLATEPPYPFYGDGTCFFRAETEVINKVQFRAKTLGEQSTAEFRCGVEPLSIEQYKERKTAAMLEIIKTQQVMHIPGAARLLDLTTRLNLPWGVGTGSPRDIATAYFEAIGLREELRHLVSIDDLKKADGTYHPGKPNQYTFNKLLKRIQKAYPHNADIASVNCSNVLVFEDQPTGAHSARRMGAQAVLCPDYSLGHTVETHIKKLILLEKEHPCPGAPEIVVVRDPSKGWHPVCDKLTHSMLSVYDGSHI